MNKYVCLLFVVSLFFYSCGKQVDELKEASELAQKAPEIANAIEKNTDIAQNIKEQRRKKGDTLAMHFTKLQEFIPTSINGYTATEPKGEILNLGAYSFSQASRNFTKSDSKGNDAFVEITIIDYNQAAELYATLTLWSVGISHEDENGYEKSFDPGIPNTFGFEKYDKLDKTAEITFAIGYRFIISVKANSQQKIDFVRSIVNSMKIKELAQF